MTTAPTLCGELVGRKTPEGATLLDGDLKFVGVVNADASTALSDDIAIVREIARRWNVAPVLQSENDALRKMISAGVKLASEHAELRAATRSLLSIIDDTAPASCADLVALACYELAAMRRILAEPAQ